MRDTIYIYCPWGVAEASHGYRLAQAKGPICLKVISTPFQLVINIVHQVTYLTAYN